MNNESGRIWGKAGDGLISGFISEFSWRNLEKPLKPQSYGD
jgi:hypothetical protein